MDASPVEPFLYVSRNEDTFALPHSLRIPSVSLDLSRKSLGNERPRSHPPEDSVMHYRFVFDTNIYTQLALVLPHDIVSNDVLRLQ